jgi:hypothetical protein
MDISTNTTGGVAADARRVAATAVSAGEREVLDSDSSLMQAVISQMGAERAFEATATRGRRETCGWRWRREGSSKSCAADNWDYR